MTPEQIALYNKGEDEITPEDLQNRKHQKAMYKKIGVVDAAKGLDTHLPEICDFGKKHKLTFGQALDYTIKTTKGREPDDDIKRNLFVRKGIKLEPDKNGPSSPIGKVLDDYALGFLMTEYQHDVFHEGIHTPWFYGDIKKHNPLLARQNLAFAPSITRTQASEQSSNIQTVGRLEMANPLITDAQVADIIGERVVIRNNRYTAPFIREPDGYQLTGIGELADIDVWEMTTGDREVVTSKAGFGVMSSYEAMRTTDLYVEQMTEFTNWIRFLTQQDLVNEGINELIMGVAETKRFSRGANPLQAVDIIEMAMRMREGRNKKGFTPNLMIASRDFILKYFSAEITMNSTNQFPLTPTGRSLIDMFRFSMPAIWRDPADVSNMPANAVAFVVDKRYCLRYIMERNSTIEETERKMSNQSITTYNTFNYAYQLMEPAQRGNARTRFRGD